MILLFKELWALRFWMFLIFLMQFLWLAYMACTDFLDEQPYVILDQEAEGVWDLFMFGALIGLGTAATALGHERRYDTQKFLDSLPVSRSRTFLTKVLAACLVTMCWPVSQVGFHLLLGAMSLTSISEGLPWIYSSQLVLLGWVHGISMVGVGMLLSFSQRWFAAFTGLALWLALWVRLQQQWWSPMLDGIELLSPVVQEGRIHSVSLVSFGGHVAVGGLCGGMACGLYLARESAATLQLMRLGRKLMLHRLGRLMPIATLVIWGLMFWSAGKLDLDRETVRDDPLDHAAASPADEGAALRFERQETEFCEFILKSTDLAAAKPLIQKADALCERAWAAFGGHGKWPGKLVVDLSANVGSHVAGQTHWTKIRLPISRSESGDALANVFLHELAHVVIEQISDGSASRHFEAMQAFHEGMATYVEVSNPDSDNARRQRRSYEIMAALAWSRGEIPVGLLLNTDKLGESRDGNLVYPAGLIFVQSLIETGGSAAPRQILQALRDHPPPLGLDGKELWQHLLNHTGHSMPLLEAAYERRMADLGQKHQGLISRLPRLNARIQLTENHLEVWPDAGAAPDGHVMICISEPVFGIVRTRRPLQRSADGCFRLPGDHLRSRVRFMLGWGNKQEDYAVFEPWVEKDAAP